MGDETKITTEDNVVLTDENGDEITAEPKQTGLLGLDTNGAADTMGGES